MSATDLQLPEQFAALERFAAEWAIPTEKGRNDFRVSRPQGELEDFYQTIFPLMDDLCTYIDQFSLDAMPRPAERLLRLGQMLMEVVPAVEVYRQPDVPNAFAFDRFHIISPDDPVKVRDN